MLWAWTLAAYAVGTAAGKTDVAATPTKDVSMWVWWCNAQQPTLNWPEFNRLLANQTDRDGINSISFVVYELKVNGTFGRATNYGVCGTEMEQKGIIGLKAARPTLKQLPLIGLGANVTGAVVRGLMADPAKRSKFIVDAVDRMKLLGFNGYNLDFEVDEEGTVSEADAYLSFMDDFAAALHAAGGELSSDLDWCGKPDGWLHHDYMGMRCGQYAASKLDWVATMRTYTANAADLEEYIEGAQRAIDGLGSKLSVGIDCSQPGNLQNATLLFDVLTRRKITRIAIWHCGSVGCYSPWFGAALRAWTNSSYAALAP